MSVEKFWRLEMKQKRGRPSKIKKSRVMMIVIGQQQHAELNKIANRENVSVSELVRRGADMVIAQRTQSASA